MDNNEVNIGRLSVLLQNAENELQNSITMAQSPTYDDYRRAKGLVIESDFFGVPEQYRASAMEDVKSGKRTYKEVMQMFENARAGGDL